MRTTKLLSLLLALGGLAATETTFSELWDLARSLSPPSLDCTTILDPSRSVQSAIDEAPPQAVICLEAGTWEEHLVITKSVTVRGSGPEQTILKGRKPFTPVIEIAGQDAITVMLERLSITGAIGEDCRQESCPNGVEIREAARVALVEAHIHSNGRAGLRAQDRAEVGLSQVKVFQNGAGIILGPGGKLQVEIADSQIFSNVWEGISGELESLQLRLERSQIFNNLWGGAAINARSANLSLADVEIFGNGNWGMSINADGQVVVWNSRIFSNEGDGLTVEAGSRLSLELKDTQIRGNGEDGVQLYSPVSVKMWNTWITDNGECGLRAPASAIAAGQGNWVHNNVEDLCKAVVPAGFLRRTPPEPLLDAVDVCPQGCPFSEIAPAIWRLKPGGVLRVQSGSYKGGIVIAKDLTLEGTGTPLITRSAWSGVLIKGPIRVRLKGVSVSGNYWCGVENENLQILKRTQILLEGLRVSENWRGLCLSGPGALTVQDVHVFKNSTDGIRIFGLGRTRVEVVRSRVEGNGTYPVCWRPNEYVCSGLVAYGEPHVTIRGSTFINNADWGVAAELKVCNYKHDFFGGIVQFQGDNVIRDNNRSGNQDGLGNPGDHPFTDLPDGQVCLPEASGFDVP